MGLVKEDRDKYLLIILEKYRLKNKIVMLNVPYYYI